MPLEGAVANLAGAVAGSILAAGTVVWGTILLRVSSGADWSGWAARLVGAPRQLLRWS